MKLRIFSSPQLFLQAEPEPVDVLVVHPEEVGRRTPRELLRLLRQAQRRRSGHPDPADGRLSLRHQEGGRHPILFLIILRQDLQNS